MTEYKNDPPDAAFIIDTAIAATEPKRVGETPIYTIVLPEGAGLHEVDTSDYLPNPVRATGRVTANNTADFIAYLARHSTDATTVWFNPETPTAVAVLDDHEADTPGWGEHRALLSLLHSDEWLFWKNRDGIIGEQEAFAEQIEDGLDDIIDPDGATLLEIAQSFHATTSAAFRQAKRLRDGTVQMQYDEDVQASAGHSGELSIPQVFKLEIPVFVGEDPVTVDARLRYRLREGKLSIGYKLDRPGRIVRAAVEAVREQVRASGVEVYVGAARS